MRQHLNEAVCFRRFSSWWSGRSTHEPPPITPENDYFVEVRVYVTGRHVVQSIYRCQPTVLAGCLLKRRHCMRHVHQSTC